MTATLAWMQRNVLCNSLAFGCHHEEIVGKLGAGRISFQWYGRRAAVARGIFSKLYKFIHSQRARIVLMVIFLTRSDNYNTCMTILGTLVPGQRSAQDVETSYT